MLSILLDTKTADIAGIFIDSYVDPVITVLVVIPRKIQRHFTTGKQ